MDHSIEWYDPARDPAVIELAASVIQRARWGLPNVLIEYDRLPPEIARINPLFQERIHHMAQAAVQAIGAQVEFVVASGKVVRADAFHMGSGGPVDLEETRASRAHAERVALARQVLEVCEQVRTASEAHRHEVNALRKAAADAAHYLNVTFHESHRFAGEFTFALPDALAVDDAAYEIGHARVLEAMNTDPNDKTDERGVA